MSESNGQPPAESPANGAGFTVWSRPLRGPGSTGNAGATPLDALRAALAVEPAEETVLYWTDRRKLCAVDLDVAQEYAFDGASLLVLLETFQPAPSLAWATHGGGLRMVYVDEVGFTAEEIGAVSLLNLGDRVPHTSLELKADTRHPRGPDVRGRFCGEVIERTQRFDPRSLRLRLNVYESTDDEALRWLEERGMAVGERYDHDRCPIDPSGQGGRKPVSVLERGICCFVCEAAGKCLGSSKPGFVPFSHLVGKPRNSVLYRMLENACHWEHARLVLDERLGLQPAHAKLVYSAGVALFRDRDIADRVFGAGKEFVRMGDRWCNLSGEPYGRDIRPVLQGLPACTYVDPDGKVKVDKGRVVLFEQSFDLAKCGYPSLTPVFGCRMREPDPEDRTIKAVVQTRELSSDEVAPLRPRYVAPDKRMDEADTWAEFERVVPGLNREYLLLLVAARGVAEGEDGMPPMVFATGPTSAAKSLTVFLAASVCGDRNTEVVWTQNGERLRQSVAEASSCGTYATFNEVFKESARQARLQATAMDFILNLTPESVSHSMYIGPTRLGRLPVFVFTDTEVPDGLKRAAQLARRLVHVPLTRAVDWENTLRDSGVGHPRRFRVSDPRRAEACDALLSTVVDRFLRPPRTFEEIAIGLGFARMADSAEAEEGRDALRDLFDAVCAAPDPTGPEANRLKGRGWKVVQRDIDVPLREAWLAVADDDNFFASRRAGEVDWKRVAQLREAARLELRGHGTRLAMRFRSVDGTRVEYRVNAELRGS